MNNGPWLRLYTDVYRNRKLRLLHETFQLRYIWFLCLHKEDKLVGSTPEEIAWELRLPLDQVIETIETLTNADLLASDLTPLGWSERQFVSDNPTERVRKHREVKRFSNVSVTPSDSDSETDSETETEKEDVPRKRGTEYTDEFETIWKAYPKRHGSNPKKAAARAYQARIKNGDTTHDQALASVNAYRAACEAKGKIGSEYVMQASSYFGQKEGYLESWPANGSKAMDPDQQAALRRKIADKRRMMNHWISEGDMAAAWDCAITPELEDEMRDIIRTKELFAAQGQTGGQGR